eukprot:c18213_g1_i1 orf=70-228(+)
MQSFTVPMQSKYMMKFIAPGRQSRETVTRAVFNLSEMFDEIHYDWEDKAEKR